MENNSVQRSERPVPTPVLTRKSLQAVLEETGAITRPDAPYLAALRWLVWLPLLSAPELARIMQRDEKTIWGYFDQLERFDLAVHVVLSEPGWPRRRRYAITDPGLYVLVARHPHPLSVPKLAASYPVERHDLLSRLSRPQVHLVLSDLASRLLSGECPPGYQLTSYQQPWQQVYHWQGNRHTFSADAALLLRAPDGAEHAFYVHVDLPERIFSQRREQDWLATFFELRQATMLSGDVLAHLLLLTTPAQYAFWAEQLEQRALFHGNVPPTGAIADYGQLARGIAAPIFLPLRQLLEHPGEGKATLFELVGEPASPRLSELFSQRFSFQHLLKQREGGSRKGGTLTRYVGPSLQQEAAQFTRLAQEKRSSAIVQVRERLRETKKERTRMAALLNLVLPAQQKALLAFLARHPLLSLPDLLVHLQPASADARPMQQQLRQLSGLGLVRLYTWEEGDCWQERERYELFEAALRFLALRHGLPPAHYLFAAQDEAPRQRISPLDPTLRWRQHGVGGLKSQMAHTNGLYRAVRHIVLAGRQSGSYTTVFWKNAREAVRWYRHPQDYRDVVFVKPDAELLYTLPSSPLTCRLLVEYDRGTADVREYQDKFTAYSAYQHKTHTELPPIVMITPDQGSAEKIRRNIDLAGAQDVRITIVLEQEVLEAGLLPVLGIQDPVPGEQ